MMGPLARVVVLLAVVGGMAAEARAQMFVTTGRDTLRGLPGLEVIVEELPPEVVAGGVTGTVVRGDVVRRLRAAGIAVFASQDENPSPAKPYLYVLVNALELPGGAGHVAGLQVHLRQTLRSPATDSHIVDAMTWELHNVFVVPPGSLPELRTEVRTFVDLFIRDWQAVQR